MGSHRYTALALVQCRAAAAAGARAAAPRHHLPQQRTVPQNLKIHLAEVLLALKHVEHGVCIARVAKAAQRPCDARQLLAIELSKLLAHLAVAAGTGAYRQQG